MKVYHLTAEVYEGTKLFSEGFKMNEHVIYIEGKGIIAQNKQNEFSYITDEELIGSAGRIVNEKGRGYVGELNANKKSIEGLIYLGRESLRTKRRFNYEAKSLFELIKEPVTKIDMTDCGCLSRERL